MCFYSCDKLFKNGYGIASPLFENCEKPWLILDKIENFILALGPALDKDIYYEYKPLVWAAKNAVIAQTANITGPCIIDENAEIRHCAYIRGNVLVGKNAVIGNSCEVKNSIILGNAAVPHFNYIGDSILGYGAHFGAGAITSNLKSDKGEVVLKSSSEKLAVPTYRKKLGALVGDFAEIGCNSVLCPGTVIGINSQIYPCSCVRGHIAENSILKNASDIILKK